MPSSSLAVWKTFGAALVAPFRLGSASWKALAGPLLALAAATGLAFVAGTGQWAEVTWGPAALLVFAVAVWLALVFQRHLLLGAAARELGARPWRRYGLYFLAMAILGIVFGVLWAILFSLVLPGVALFLMALNSSAPWLAAGAVILGVLAFTVAAYLPARLALMLPALAVDHDPGFARTWRLTKGNGLRLLALLVVIPGVLHGLGVLALSEVEGVLSLIILDVILGSYLFLVDLGILAFAYRALSDQALPVVSSDGASAWFATGAAKRAPRANHALAPSGLTTGNAWSESAR